MRTFNAIREVVIYGSMPQVSAGISNMLGKLKEENKYMPRQTPVVSFDFFSIFTAKKRKRTEKRIKALENY